ncbi:hypothetical protein ACTA71_007542 [Dictyostelium dimigraforme]
MYNNNRINQFQQQQQQQQQTQYNTQYYGQYQQQGMMGHMQYPNQYQQHHLHQQQMSMMGHMPQQYGRFSQQMQQQQQQQQQQQLSDSDLSLYIGDLATDVTDQQLMNSFQGRYPSVRSARVIIDSTTGVSRGYGFVKFASEVEKDKALIDMNGFYINNKPIKVNNPTHKRLNSQTSTIPDLTSTDPNNTAIYVSQLDHYIDEGVLQTIFGAYGEISYIKMLTNKFSAFVNFVNRESAEAAFGLNNYPVGNTRLKVQWGKNVAPPPKSPPMTPTNVITPPIFSNIPLTSSPSSHGVVVGTINFNETSYNNSNINNNNNINNNSFDNNINYSYTNSNIIKNNNRPNGISINYHRNNSSIYDPHYSYFSNEKLDITEAYNVTEENIAYLSWNKPQFTSNFYSQKTWGLPRKEKDGPDSSVFEA